MTQKKTYWNDLRYSCIVGHIDGYECVHSVKIKYDEPGSDRTHSDIFGPCLKGWRWDYSIGLDFSVFSDRVDSDDCDRVRDHLTNVYGMPFMKNGYHDIHYIMDMMDKEYNEDKKD